MRKLGVFIIVLVVFGMAAPALAVDFEFHGDMNNRFLLYTDKATWFGGNAADQQTTLQDGTVDDNFGEIKYRFWFDAVSDDGKVKGVFATEIGGLRFGQNGAMPYSGDQVRMEVRWAYLDLQIPGIDQKTRVQMGLMPFTVNPYKWQETVGGVNFYGDAGPMEYSLAWVRGQEVSVTDPDDDREDSDGLFGRLNFKPMDDLKIGLFGLFEGGDDDSPIGSISSQSYEVKRFAGNVDLNLWTFGLDGGFASDAFFLNWDLMYQTGDIDDTTFIVRDYFGQGVDLTGFSGDFDVSAYFLHADAGLKFGNTKLTYTFWYSSGDDDPLDGDLDAFLGTDVDINASIAIMQGGYIDDTYFTELPYILDKGFIMNKLALDSKLTDKLTVGAAVLYMMTAEDIEYVAAGAPQSNDEIGWELDAYIKYMLYSNVEFAVNAGYLWADDAMDFFEVDSIRDGESDEDIFTSTARVRYTF